MSEFNCLTVSTEDRVLTITLNRPDAANGLNLAMATELAVAAKAATADENVKAVVLTGEGRFFCAGGDVKAMSESDQPGDAVAAIAEALHKAILIFSEMSKPVVCAVNGTAAGAGFSLAVSADLVVASPQAKFTMAYSNIGLSPDGSSSYYLPRLVGLRKTQELMYTNRVLTAEEALDWHLINQVSESALETAQELAAKLAKGSGASNKAIKDLLNNSNANSLAQQLALEQDTIKQCADGEDGREGVSAFVSKRRPEFK